MAAKFLISSSSRSMRAHAATTVVPLLLILGLFLARPATAIPLANLDSSSLLSARQEPQPGGLPLPDGATDSRVCQFSGDEDMYGLGIRVGYYIQWAATVFGAYFTPKIVSGAFEANAIFNIGMLAGLIFSTIKRNNMHVVEPLIVLGFSIGGAIVGLLDPKNMHDPKNLKSIRLRLVHLCGTGALSLPLIIYWTWYSFYGMDTLSFERECPAYTFMIVKVNVWAVWFRYFMKSAIIIALVSFLVLAIAVIVVYRMKTQSLPHPSNESTFDFARNPPPRLSRTPTAMAQRARPTGVQFVIVIIACILCALNVELSILWNNIQDVNALGATGQLIPMAIGIITSVRVCLGILGENFKSRKTLKKERKRERIFGEYSRRDRPPCSCGDETIKLGPGGGVVPVKRSDDSTAVEKSMAEDDSVKEKNDGISVTTRPKMTPSSTMDGDTISAVDAAAPPPPPPPPPPPAAVESSRQSMGSSTRNKLKRKSLIESRRQSHDQN